MPLRHKLFLIIALLSCVPLLVLLFGVVNRLETEIRDRTEKEVHVSLGKMAEELRLIIDNQQSIARGLIHDLAIRQFASVTEKPVDKRASSLEYRQRAETLEQFFLNYQKAVPDIQALRFMDRQGKTLVKVKEGKLIPPKLYDEEYRRMFVSDQSNKAFFKQAIDHPSDVIMSDFELGQTTENADFCPAMVRYTARIRDEVDHEQGVLVVNMWGKRLDATIEASLGGYPGQAYLVELNDDAARDGIYLYHKDSSRRFADQLKSEFRFTNQISSQEWQSIKNGKDVGTLRSTDGRMFFYRILRPFVTRPSVGWLLVIEADTATVLKPVYNLRKSIWWLLGILVLASLISAVLVAWRMTKPVYQLADTMKRYADGDGTSVYTESRGDEIGAAGRAFNYLTSRLQQTEQERDKAVRVACQSERLAAVGQLAAGIGHEINNPLMNIMSLAALIEDEVRDKAPQAYADTQILQKEGRRCAGIVQGILSFAREKPPEYREFDMVALITETMQLLQHRLAAADIRTNIDMEDELLMSGDASQLQQVLVNVILNAVQASPEHAEIRIAAHNDMDHVSIEIIDSGIGIDTANINKVFDPFFTTKNQGEGTGLGLSVSYGIVKRHGGNIYLENNPEAGLRVMIILPRRANETVVADIDMAKEVMHVA